MKRIKLSRKLDKKIFHLWKCWKEVEELVCSLSCRKCCNKNRK